MINGDISGEKIWVDKCRQGVCYYEYGQMALVPPLVKVGDLCVHVKGGYVPLTLRKIESEERRAELVGACKMQDVDDVYFGEELEDWSVQKNIS